MEDPRWEDMIMIGVVFVSFAALLYIVVVIGMAL